MRTELIAKLKIMSVPDGLALFDNGERNRDRSYYSEIVNSCHVRTSEGGGCIPTSPGYTSTGMGRSNAGNLEHDLLSGYAPAGRKRITQSAPPSLEQRKDRLRIFNANWVHALMADCDSESWISMFPKNSNDFVFPKSPFVWYVEHRRMTRDPRLSEKCLRWNQDRQQCRKDADSKRH